MFFTTNHSGTSFSNGSVLLSAIVTCDSANFCCFGLLGKIKASSDTKRRAIIVYRPSGNIKDDGLRCYRSNIKSSSRSDGLSCKNLVTIVFFNEKHKLFETLSFNCLRIYFSCMKFFFNGEKVDLRLYKNYFLLGMLRDNKIHWSVAFFMQHLFFIFPFVFDRMADGDSIVWEKRKSMYSRGPFLVSFLKIMIFREFLMVQLFMHSNNGN